MRSRARVIAPLSRRCFITPYVASSFASLRSGTSSTNAGASPTYASKVRAARPATCRCTRRPAASSTTTWLRPVTATKRAASSSDLHRNRELLSRASLTADAVYKLVQRYLTMLGFKIGAQPCGQQQRQTRSTIKPTSQRSRDSSGRRTSPRPASMIAANLARRTARPSR